MVACMVLAGCQLFPSRAEAVELKPATEKAFERYAQLTESRIQHELNSTDGYLYVDRLPEKQRQTAFAKLREGQSVIETLRTRDNGRAVDVPDGLIHHWIATSFVPGATREQAMALAQDYSRHPQLYGPDVQGATVLTHDGNHYVVRFRFYRKAIVTAVYNVDFNVDCVEPDAARGHCDSRAVRIAEVENPGKAGEKEYPIGNDHGYMWKLNLYARYVERDGGVYIEVEFLALSRSVPAVFAWLVNPYVKSIPREYLANYMLKTKKALTTTSAD